MKKLEQFLARDASLIAIECWGEGKNVYSKKIFNIPFATQAFLHNNGIFEFYADLTRFADALPKEMNEMYKADKAGFMGKLLEIRRKMGMGLKIFSQAPSITNKTILQQKNYLEKVAESLTYGSMGVYICHQFPIFYEAFAKKGKPLLDKKLISEIITWRRKEGELFFTEGVNAVYSLLSSIARRLGVDENLLHHIRYRELMHILEKSAAVPVRTLQRRKEGIYLYFDDKTILEKEIQKSLKQYGYYLKRNKKQYSKKIIRGFCACRGRERGRVRVVLNRKQLNKVEQGDILFAPMTNPWYAPILGKVRAIVTDEGGITCHAAVVSRESNIPCVIGTKIATNVFKDGDKVEVDATNGIVRKL